MRHEYNLAAMIGESWRVNPMPPPFDSAKVVNIYPYTVFGQPVIIKKIDYWQRFELGDSLWYGTRYLATGFGLVRWDIEPSDVWYLAGAIIDSVQWGVIDNVKENEEPLPKTFVLSQNYPNPFNPATTIVYEVPRSSHVKLEVFDVLGQLTTTLVDQTQVAGTYQVQFDASRLSSGVYLYRLRAGDVRITKRMLLLR